MNALAGRQAKGYWEEEQTGTLKCSEAYISTYLFVCLRLSGKTGSILGVVCLTGWLSVFQCLSLHGYSTYLCTC